MRILEKVSRLYVVFLVCIGMLMMLWMTFLWMPSPSSANEIDESGQISEIYSISPSSEITYYSQLPIMLNNSTGKVIEVAIPGGNDLGMFEEATRAFSEQTGHRIVYIEVDDFENVIVDMIENGEAPDLAIFPQPGILGGLNAGGYAIDITDWFAPGYLQQQYDQSWLDMATFDGEMAGVWYKASLKSLVWYPKQEFDNAGYSVPQTWAEMVSLSDQMVLDGRTPWCIGIESGFASGWPGTDWVEDIMLRTTTPQNYDQWVDGTLDFSSPEVKSAFEEMGDIWFAPDYVLGGRSAITNTWFGDAPAPMFEDPPDCWMHRQASFITGMFPDGVTYGVDYDYFYLPPINPTYGKPALVAGDIYGVFADRPEVREFVTFLTTGESVRVFVEAGGILSPHEDSDLSWYPTDAERGFAEIVQNATAVRFDASDLMPGEVGAGTFWTGIIDYVDGRDLDTILSEIDASWP